MVMLFNNGENLGVSITVYFFASPIEYEFNEGPWLFLLFIS